MIYGLTFLWCIPSPLFLFINAEAWVITNVLLGNGVPVFIALSAAAGQVIGFCTVLLASERVITALPKLDAKLGAFDAQRYERWSYAALSIGCVVGIPPAILLTLCGRAFGYRFLPYLIICICGRSLRFLILAHAPAYFAQLLGIAGY